MIKKNSKFLKNYRFTISSLTSAINAFLFIIFGIVLIVFVNFNMRQYAIETAKQKARIILDHNFATHMYFTHNVKPSIFKLTDQITSDDYFDPVWMSSTYAVREIDKYFHSMTSEKDYFPSNYYYKECAINARSPKNEADSYEKSFLKTVNSVNSSLEAIALVRKLTGKPFYTVLRRAEVMEESCLKCHGDPRNAPKEMVAIYGSERSFHRKIGDIASAVSIRIPLASAYSAANKTSIVLTFLLFVSFVLIYSIQFLINRRFIFQPLSVLQGKADKITTGDESIGTEMSLPKGFELRSLAHAFNRMSFRLRDHIDNLDDKIEKRTNDIKRINESLKGEIEEHQRTNNALLESEQIFRQIFNHTAVGIAQISFDFRIEKANRAYCSMLGYSEKELIGKHLADITHPEDVGENLREQKRLGTGVIEHYRMEKAFVHKNGNKIYGILDANLIKDKDKNPKYFLGSVVDITKRKGLEDQLVQNQKMESIGTLAGGIAHDFNNILSAIIGFTELSLDEVEKETTLASNLQEVYSAGNRAKDLVKQILTISRHDKKEVKPILLAPLVKESLKMLRSTIPSTIEFQEKISSDQLVVSADPTQLQQIVVNLATNAKHAMVEGSGVLIVEVDAVAFGPDIQYKYPDMQPGNYARITVSDTGSGIPAKNLEKIFEPYFTTKEKGEGTGLGLSVVHGIVKSHNGHITVYSEDGKGTTFHVYLPLITKTSADQPEKAVEPLTGGSEKILIVDDELPIVKMQQQILERLGYAVTGKISSLAALESFQKFPNNFDLLITDMTMPKMTGDKLAEEVKAIRSNIPVILCTGFSEKVHGQGEKFSIDSFLMKPIDKVTMAKIVRKVLDAAKGKNQQ